MHSFAIHGVNVCGDNNEIYVAWLPGCNVAALPPIQVIQKRFSTVEFWGGAHACFTFGGLGRARLLHVWGTLLFECIGQFVQQT